jgi:hypothetical protein
MLIAGREEGRKGGREEGRKGGREEGRKEEREEESCFLHDGCVPLRVPPSWLAAQTVSIAWGSFWPS